MRNDFGPSLVGPGDISYRYRMELHERAEAMRGAYLAQQTAAGVRWLARTVRQCLATLRARLKEQATYAELTHLDERTLVDIGLNRSMLMIAARGIDPRRPANENEPVRFALPKRADATSPHAA